VSRKTANKKTDQTAVIITKAFTKTTGAKKVEGHEKKFQIVPAPLEDDDIGVHLINQLVSSCRHNVSKLL